MNQAPMPRPEAAPSTPPVISARVQPNGRNFALVEGAISNAIAAVHTQIMELQSAYDPSTGQWMDRTMDEHTAVHTLRHIAMHEYGNVLHFIRDLPKSKMHPRHHCCRGVMVAHNKHAPQDPVRYIAYLLATQQGVHEIMSCPPQPKNLRGDLKAMFRAQDIAAEVIRKMAAKAR